MGLWHWVWRLGRDEDLQLAYLLLGPEWSVGCLGVPVVVRSWGEAMSWGGGSLEEILCGIH